MDDLSSAYREQSHKSYRPLTVLTFRWNLLLSGGVLVPSHFHLVNVLLHALVVALLHRLLLSILGGASRRGRRIATVASSLFAAHPVRNTYTQKYTYVASNSTAAKSISKSNLMDPSDCAGYISGVCAFLPGLFPP